MWNFDTSSQGSSEQRNTAALLRFGLVVAVALFIASQAPRELVLATFGGLMLLGAIISCVLAALEAEEPFARHLTRWDEAAGLAALAFLARAFVDKQAVLAATQQLAAS